MLAESVRSARDGSKIVCGRFGAHKREKGEIGVASLRLANVVGEHEVIIAKFIDNTDKGLTEYTIIHYNYTR